MILLEPHNVIIRQVLTDKFAKPTSLDQAFVDFDSVRYHLTTPNTKVKTQILLSMALPCWDELVQHGARDVLRAEYGDLLLEEVEPEYNVSLMIDLEKVPAEAEARQSLIHSLSLLKRHAISAPFLSAFAKQRELEATPPPTDGSPAPKGQLLEVHYRDEEAIYIQAGHDRVTVVFSTVFREETDRVFGRLFLQEFVDARRLPSIQTAPQVLYSTREPPLEIRHLPGLAQTEDVGYVTFVLFPRHFTNPTVSFATISRIQLFRDYLHYHIKCSKAYMHSRMRTRVASFLKVLNRAVPEKAEGGERKTASGRTFKSR